MKCLNFLYAHNALEPVISQQNNRLPLRWHLQTYVNNLNNLVPGTGVRKTKTWLLSVATAPGRRRIQQCRTGTETIRCTSCNSHETVAKRTYRETGGSHQTRLRQFREFKNEFAAAVGLFGSGWAWLSVDKNGKLHITKEANGKSRTRRT